MIKKFCIFLFIFLSILIGCESDSAVTESPTTNGNFYQNNESDDTSPTDTENEEAADESNTEDKETEDETETADESEEEDDEEEAQNIDYNNGRNIIWAGGIKGPAEGELVQEGAPLNGLYYWYETSQTEWFNVVKTLNGDSNMCWALSAVNVLHWWCKQNSNNISNFIEKEAILDDKLYLYDYTYNPIAPKKYDYEEIPENLLKNQSAIADIFRGNSDKHIEASFTNSITGGYSDSAVCWYIYSNMENSLGLFRKVFDGDNPDIISLENSVTKDNFTDIIRTALSEKRVLTMDYNIFNESGTTQHCVNIWGATFNDDGFVTELWIGDSNYKQNRLFNMKTVYKDDGIYIIPAYNNAQTTTTGLNKRILFLTSFSSQKKQFANYLSAH